MARKKEEENQGKVRKFLQLPLLDVVSFCQNAISRSHGKFSEVRENESWKSVHLGMGSKCLKIKCVTGFLTEIGLFY